MPSVIQPSFAGGVIGPALHARVDIAKYAVSLRTGINVFVHPHGGVSNRAGLQMIAECKDHNARSRLLPFEFNTTQTYVIEAGNLYMRFIKDAGQIVATPSAWSNVTAYVANDAVTSGGTTYVCVLAHTNQVPPNATYWYALTGDIFEIATPYVTADIPTLKNVQSADVMTLTHPSYDVRELSRTGHAAWSLATVTFAPLIATPSGWAGTPAVAGAETYEYKVTAVADETFEESLPQAVTAINAATPLSSTNKITISAGAATTGAVKYNIYRQKNGGLFGFIGATESTSFVDDNITPDTNETPPSARNPFTATGDKPGTVSYFEQRRVFGGSTNQPDTSFFTQPGNTKNMSVSSPTRDDDAITATLNARKVNEIRHYVPMNDLIVLTSGAEWKVGSGNDSGFSSVTLKQKPQSYWGASHVPPIVIGSTALFVQERGSLVRSLIYDASAGGYSGGYDGADLSLLAYHFFEGKTVVEWAYSQIPHSLVWCVMSDGTALSLTFNKEQQVVAWTQHTTDGFFESVASVAEADGNEDAVYFIVRRTIGGVTKRYVERLHSRVLLDTAVASDGFFVDSGLTYSGAAATVISGLDHLEGKTVVALADGNVVRNLVVTGGAVTLPNAATLVHVGLPYVSDIETLNVEAPRGTIQGKTKRIAKVVVRFLRSRGLFVGPTFDDLTEMKWRENELMGQATSLLTGDKEQILDPSWNTNGRVAIRQSYPLPMTILAVIPDVLFGG